MLGSSLFLGRSLYAMAIAVTALLLLRLVLFWREKKFRLRALSGSEAIGLCAALLITASVFLLQPPDYRILQDEAVLTSMSFMMAKYHTANALYTTRRVGDAVLPVALGVDKRPPLFPFASHLLHLLTGYRVSNPYIVNGLALGGLLFLLFLFLEPLGISFAVAGQLLVAAQPAVFLSATSAGFDLFSLFFFALSLWVCFWAKRERRAVGFVLACLSLGAFLTVRYEGVVPAAILLLWLAGRDRAWVYEAVRKEVAWLGLLALSLLPMLSLFTWWVRNPGLRESDVTFSPGFLAQHLVSFVSALLWSPPQYPQLAPLHWLCLASGIFLALTLGNEKGRKALRQFGGMLGAVAATTLVMLTLFFGDISHTDALRLFLPAFTLLALLPAIAAGLHVRKKPKHRAGAAAACLAIALLAFAHGLTARSAAEMFADVGSTNAYKVGREVLEKYPPTGTIVVSRFPTNFAILRYSALDFDLFLQSWEALMGGLGNELHVVIFQNVDAASGLPRKGEELEGIPVRVLKEVEISSRSRLRVLELGN